MPVRYSVYTLADPRTKEVRYVGVTNNPEKRYKSHLTATYDSDEKKAWIEELANAGVLPLLVVVERDKSKPEAYALEASWMHHYITADSDLVNKEYTDAKRWRNTNDLLRRLKIRSIPVNHDQPITSTPEITIAEAQRVIRRVVDGLRKDFDVTHHADKLERVIDLLSSLESDSSVESA